MIKITMSLIKYSNRFFVRVILTKNSITLYIDRYSFYQKENSGIDSQSTPWMPEQLMQPHWRECVKRVSTWLSFNDLNMIIKTVNLDMNYQAREMYWKQSSNSPLIYYYAYGRKEKYKYLQPWFSKFIVHDKNWLIW